MSNEKVAATFSGEATGGHTKAKLTDNPYRHAVDPRDVPPAVAAEARIPRLTDEQCDRLYAEIFPQPAEPERRRGLTPGEIGLGMGIVVFIILLFLFIAFSYRGW